MQLTILPEKKLLGKFWFANLIRIKPCLIPQPEAECDIINVAMKNCFFIKQASLC